ncbi:MAG TPA: hypothetical protein PLQ56_11700 [Aggregatilineales bacterium]|nr:hypothetical protein [Aggregatilineales bacterium]
MTMTLFSQNCPAAFAPASKVFSGRSWRLGGSTVPFSMQGQVIVMMRFIPYRYLAANSPVSANWQGKLGGRWPAPAFPPTGPIIGGMNRASRQSRCHQYDTTALRSRLAAVKLGGKLVRMTP